MFRKFFVLLAVLSGAASLLSSCANSSTTRTGDGKTVQQHYYGGHQTGTNL